MTAASAADLPVKAAVKAPVAALPSWTGFYIGAHGGYRWADASFADPPISAAYDPNGGIIGAHGGYNYLVAPNFLIGIEGDWSWGWGSDSVASSITIPGEVPIVIALNSEAKLTWQATLRGRAGYVNGPWLFYLTAGGALTEAKWNISFGPLSAGDSKVLGGWVVGGGAEYMLNANWLARLEYLYESFGDFGVTINGAPAGTFDLDHVQKVRVGISYKFN
jgi:outer membrane immunogenic protein